jgi:hypothetical protein
MKKFIIDIVKNLLGSLNNKANEGFSARKLTAFTFMACIVYMHYIWGLNNNFSVEILICDIVGVSFFLGLITFDQIIKLKNNGSDN